MGRRSRKRRPTAIAPKPAAVTAKPVSRSEQRNAEARAKLKPLAPGERPPAVTAAAVVAIAVPSAIMLVAGIGMWRAKYWAVLGFQALLGILICYLALFMVRASNLLGLVVPLAIILPSGYLFWKLVKSLARIQMPENPSRRPR